MKNWKRILAAAGTAALLVSNLGAVSQVTFAAEDAPIEEVVTEPETPSEEPENETPAEPVVQAEETQEQEVTETPAPEQGEKQPDETTETPAVVTPSNNGETNEVEQPVEPKAENPAEPAEQTPEAPEKVEETKEPEVVDEPGKEETVDVQPEEVVQPTEGTTEEPEVEEPEDTVDLIEYDVQLDGIKVIAKAAPGVVPDGAVLKASIIEKQSKLDDVEEALNESTAVTYEDFDFLALDVHFDLNDEEIEPDGAVAVSFDIKRGTLTAGIDTENLTVQHLEENKAGDITKVTTVADTDGQKEETGFIDVATSTATENVAPAMTIDFEVEQFSTFTISWPKDYYRSYFDITVEFVDADGTSLGSTQSDITIGNGESVTIADYSNKLNSEYTNYTYEGAYYNSINDSNKVTTITASQSTSQSGEGRPGGGGPGGQQTTRTLTFTNQGGDTVSTLSATDRDRNAETATIYMVFKAPDAPVVSVADLERSKKVIEHTDGEGNRDGTYDLELSVSGAVGKQSEKAKVDILLILDRSSSMWDNFGYSDRMTAVQKAACDLIDTVSSNTSISSRFNVVQFGSYRMTKIIQDWTNAGTDAKKMINNISYQRNVGTNYWAGIKKGIEALGNARTGAQTIVVFLTDGIPTMNGTDDNKGYGTGQTDPDDYNLHQAVNAIGDMSCSSFYAIGVGDNFNSTLSQLINGYTDDYGNFHKGVQVADGGTKKVVSVTTTNALQNEFAAIADSTKVVLADHVVLSDELSNSVEIVPAFEIVDYTDITITVTKKDATTNNTSVVVTGKGKVHLDKTENNDATDLTVQLNDAKNKITLDFGDDYKLEPDYTYTVSTRLQPTEIAYEEYRAEGYADEATDSDGKKTGEKGLFSNGQATIEYSYNGKEYTKNFDRPVIKLHAGTLNIEQTYDFDDLTDEEIAEVKAALAAGNYGVALTWGNSKSNTDNANLPTTVAQSGKGWTENGTTSTYSYSDGLSPDTAYTVTAPKVTLDDYEIEITPVNNSDSGKIAQGASATASFKVSVKKSTGSLQVSKSVTGDKEYTDATSFEIKITVNGTGNKTYKATGVATEVTFRGNEYTVTLKNGESITINGLRKGSDYTVQELASSGSDKGFTVTYNNVATDKATGKIKARETQSVDIVNNIKIVKTGVDLGNNAFPAMVLAVDAMVVMFLAYGYVKRRINY